MNAGLNVRSSANMLGAHYGQAKRHIGVHGINPLQALQKEDGLESLPKRRLLPQRIAH
jgi:hypothetical protein